MITAAERLKETRISKNLSIEDVSKATKIKTSFIVDIEAGEYGKLPSISYAQGFVRNYADFLGLNEEDILPLFRREFDAEKTYKVLPKGFEAREEFSLSRIKLGQTIIFIAFILIVFFSYIFYQYRYAFLNPPLYIVFPKDGSIVRSSEVTVVGRTDSNATVYVNDNSVTVDSNGNFQKVVNVFPGKTVIDIKAVNKFLRQTDKKLQINIQPGS